MKQQRYGEAEMRIETKPVFEFRPSRPLKTHLSQVANQTLSFLPSHLSNLAYRAGLWHDLGKYRLEWQNYLKSLVDGVRGQKIPHAIHGAILAYRLKLPSVAIAISGHHSGLPDVDELGEMIRNPESAAQTDEAIANALTELDLERDIEPEINPSEFVVRMLFSALVDANQLDCENEIPEEWSIGGLNIENIPPDNNPINLLRSQFFQQCQDAAIGKRGFYRITGPSGIGKTRSAMQFALKHCQENGMRGVIYLSPFCSILDQSYRIYQELLGEDNLIASWSSFDLGKEEDLKRYQWLAERWDAPIVLSTTVNFFDSILSNKPNKLRKIHQLQNRCIILDEPQSLPRDLLSTVLNVLDELVNNWGCTIVLSSATNPAFEQLPEFNQSVVDVIPKAQVETLFKRFNRCKFTRWSESVDLNAIADDIEQTTGSGLVVLNTKKLAREGFELFRDRFDKVWHLSTDMCPVHRRKILDEALPLLSKGEGVLVSTSLIEAGIDLDCVRAYRQLAGLDSIYQISGRVNRNGLQEGAELIIFEIEGTNIRDVDMKARIDITKHLLSKETNLENPKLFDEFFRRYYAGDRDESKIEQLRKKFKFRQVAEKFKMIDTITQPVIVEYDDQAEALIKSIGGNSDNPRKLLRDLSQYSVVLQPSDIKKYKKNIVDIDGFLKWEGDYGESGISRDLTS